VPALPHPPPPAHAIKDKSVLITGAGRGIGKRIAIGFAAAGARIGLLARSKAELDLADLEIEHNHGSSLRLRADVRDYEQVAAAVDRMRVHYGGVHLLVCAAGIPGPIGPFSELDPKHLGDVIQTNLLGAMNACRAVLPEMVRRRSGKIILLAGNGGDQPRPAFSPYAASKAALVRFAETLAEEVAADNVQVNCINPGATYTAMTDEILRAGELAGEKEHREAAQVRTTGGTPHDRQIALCLFLASDRSNHISGKLLNISDNWKRLEHQSLTPESFALRRVMKV
jgi:NAD(P)-dependent dehydrogenase (short-subunit alcohol dehydrogenase family)